MQIINFYLSDTSTEIMSFYRSATIESLETSQKSEGHLETAAIILNFSQIFFPPFPHRILFFTPT